MSLPVKKVKFQTVSSALTVPIDNNDDLQSDTERKEDWTQNHVILSEIFRHLPVPDLKIVRFVCKFWAQIAAPFLTAKSVLRINHSNLKQGKTATEDLLAFLDSDGNRCWDSGFKPEMQNVELNLIHLDQNEEEWFRVFSWDRSALEAFQKFVTSNQFCFVTFLKLEHVYLRTVFTLFLPYWLPTYGKKLKTLYLTHVRDWNDAIYARILLPIPVELPPEGVELDLEDLTIDCDHIVEKMEPRFWDFLRNCPKLKHLALPNVRDFTSLETLEAYLKSILQALGNTQLESLALKFGWMLNLAGLGACRSFTKRLVEANGRNLKRFSVELQPYVPAQLSSEAVAPTWELAPSVKMARFHLHLGVTMQTMPLPIRLLRQILAQLMSLIHQQWFSDGRRLEIQFVYYVFQYSDLNVKLIIESPKKLVLQFGSMEALENADNVFLQNVLPGLFPEVNYVCFARQSPTDGGLGYETTLLERFGTDGVFEMITVLRDMTSACGYGEDTQGFKMEFLRLNQLTRSNILDPEVIRKAAVGELEGWNEYELMRGFVFGHVPQNQMAAAWTKIQSQAHTFKSVEDGFTPEVVTSGQGSFTVCRKFIT